MVSGSVRRSGVPSFEARLFQCFRALGQVQVLGMFVDSRAFGFFKHLLRTLGVGQGFDGRIRLSGEVYFLYFKLDVP